MRFITRQMFFLALICLLCVNEGLAQGKKKRKVIDKAIVAAESYIGTPYHYGGTSRKGIDCSGLIQNCYSQIGIELPRTAKEQSKVGKSKSWGSIRPGDIVYFKFKQKGEKWYHTGMITEVKGEKIKFIHASTSRGVVESNLNDDYYRKNVKKFKRVI
ncbi:MAG: NlpC/P60 family protein [Cyclobacteriaceae bacterium]